MLKTRAPVGHDKTHFAVFCRVLVTLCGDRTLATPARGVGTVRRAFPVEEEGQTQAWCVGGTGGRAPVRLSGTRDFVGEPSKCWSGSRAARVLSPPIPTRNLYEPSPFLPTASEMGVWVTTRAQQATHT